MTNDVIATAALAPKRRRAACRVLAAALLGCGLTACGTAPSAPSMPQQVRVETPGCAAALCVLSNDQGTWTVDPTPGDVQLMTSARALEVSCRARDQSAGTSLSPDPLRPVSPASTAVGGAAGAGVAIAAFSPLLATPYAPLVGVFAIYTAVAGAGVGRAVDASARSYSYPSPVVLPFRCDSLGLDSVALAAAPLGMAVRGATAANEPRSAAIVSALAPGGRAAQSGLLVGDAIVSAQGRPVDSPAALELVVREVPATMPLTLGVLRAGAPLTIVTPPREQR
jgi:hypothetical protein